MQSTPWLAGTLAVAYWVHFVLFRLSPCSLAVSTALSLISLNAAAQETVFSPVMVSATRIDMQDQDAPYASEVHTRREIAQSGATSLYDYLAQHTSLQVTPSYGNRYTPQISMRGYGNDGFQNLVISLNGRRLNNIDSMPQLIGAISLADIDRIEITKGSGAVMFGDGAMAGTIQIYTKARERASLEAYAGNYGTRGVIASAGVVRENFDLSATADHGLTKGLSDKDPSGNTDNSEANTWHVEGGFRAVQGLRLNAEAGASHIDTRYPSALTDAQFEATPGMNKGSDYTHQKLKNRHWGLGAEYELNAQWKLSARHYDETKTSLYPAWDSVADYHHQSNELAVQFKQNAMVLNAGWQNFDAKRTQSTDRTSKDSQAFFMHGQYMLEATTLSAGLRREQVKYRYTPVSGDALERSQHLTAWEVGANHRITPALALFANYSDAFATPDIDRFFTTDWGSGSPVTMFNGFIEPAKSRTLTLGANHETERNRLKLAAFYVKLSNEIYYFKEGPFSGLNTNIDKSHKYGLEVQDYFQLTPAISGHINYAWTKAVIDREDQGGGAFDGKELPGVPQHSVALGVNWRVVPHGNLHVTHTWRSRTWAAEDFANQGGKQQRAFQSTDVTYRHQLAKHLEMYASVSNLFARKNGMWVRNDAVYPIDFERTWKLGARLSF